jgi:hypothetical protein
VGKEVFLGSLISSHHLGSEDCLSEDESLSIHGIPIHKWIDRACGYSFRKDLWDDQACGFSFQQDFLPPTHLHEFHFMIEYMSIYAHDYYMLELSLLYYIIKHKGRYIDDMISWLR